MAGFGAPAKAVDAKRGLITGITTLLTTPVVVFVKVTTVSVEDRV